MIIYKGGWMIYPILVCSIIALAVVADRAFAVMRLKFTPDDVFDKAIGLVKNGESPRAVQAIKETGSSFSSLYEEILLEDQEKEMEKTALNRGGELIETLGARLQMLSLIVTIAPIMGLLGTVLGMIRLFSSVAQQQSSADISVLATGIWEALITTAAGLAVAIPALIAFRLFQSFLDKAVSRMQRRVNQMISAAGATINGSV